MHAFEDGGDHVAPVVAVGAGEGAEVAEQARALLAVRAVGLLVVDEREEFVAGDAVRLGRPVAPTVGRIDGGFELFAGELGLALALDFEVVEEFQEHDPCEHRQAVEVAVEALILAHDVARGLEEGAAGLDGGGAGRVGHVD